ncbi:MAG: ATP-binding protein, partial [Acidimicrobiia bacterium]
HIVASHVLLPSARRKPPAAADRLLDFGQETVSLVDVDGTIRLTKGANARTQGYPTAYWRDRNVRDLLAPGEWERVVEHRDRVLASPGASAEFEVEILTGSGDSRLIATQLVNCLEEPELAGLVVVTRDVTDERSALTELARSRRSAEAVGDARTRLLATVSHELRNPLHAVHGLAELLVDEALPPSAAELAGSLLRQISSLRRLTDDLLDAARLDAGSVTIDPVPTDLLAVVRDVIDLGRAGIGDKPVTVTSRIAPGVPSWVSADADRLRQVLGNLVGNALKFTDRGSVQLVVRPDGPGSVAFSIIDSGVGIPPAEQGTVLEPFAVGSTAGAGRGAGLGLSIVQRLVTAMGGRLTLTSTVGEGSRFDVSLPLPAQHEPEPEREVGGLRGVRVLAVEDNPVNQQLVERQLERLEIDAVVVGTGEAGFEQLVSGGPTAFDVVLMDHQLPGWSGTETTERIRALDGAVGSIPIIGLSAATSSADRERFIAAGMDDLVPKPATINDLAVAIDRVLSDRGRTASGAPRVPDGVPSDVTPVAVNVDVLGELVADLDDRDIVIELVRVFLDELDGRVALVAGDDEAASRRAAHTVASSARLLGAMSLGDLCEAIERGDAAPELVHDASVAVRAGLEEWLYDRDR